MIPATTQWDRYTVRATDSQKVKKNINKNKKRRDEKGAEKTAHVHSIHSIEVPYSHRAKKEVGTFCSPVLLNLAAQVNTWWHRYTAMTVGH